MKICEVFMFYFSVFGDSHVFDIPLEYLEKVCSHFLCNDRGDDASDYTWLVDVYYALHTSNLSFECVQLHIHGDPGCHGYFITIDFDYSNCIFPLPMLDQDKIILHAKCYKLYIYPPFDVFMSFTSSSEFVLGEFLNDYYEDIQGFSYRNLLFSDEDIKKAIDKPYPW